MFYANGWSKTSSNSREYPRPWTSRISSRSNLARSCSSAIVTTWWDKYRHNTLRRIDNFTENTRTGKRRRYQKHTRSAWTLLPRTNWQHPQWNSLSHGFALPTQVWTKDYFTIFWLNMGIESWEGEIVSNNNAMDKCPTMFFRLNMGIKSWECDRVHT